METSGHITDELCELLAGVGCDAGDGEPAGPNAEDSPGPYVVERVLKESPAELTQLVRRRADGCLLVRKRFAREGGLGGAYRTILDAQARGVRMPHVPEIVSCEDEDDALVVVMEYVEGVTLRELVGETPANGRAELAERVFPTLCAAAGELHRAAPTPVIHRDLTPGNVIVDPEHPARLKLIDLGIARSWHEGAGVDTTHFGTRAYAPPEQYGFGQTDVRADVFALGLVLFFCLTGRDPSPEDRERAWADPCVPEGLRRVIARAAAFDPAERHASAADLARAFEAACVAGGADWETGGPAAASAAVGSTPSPATPASAPADHRMRTRRAGSSRTRPAGRIAASPVPGDAFDASVWNVVTAVWDVLVVAFFATLLVGFVQSTAHKLSIGAPDPIELVQQALTFVSIEAVVWAFVDLSPLPSWFPRLFGKLHWRRGRHVVACLAVALVAFFVGLAIS